MTSCTGWRWGSPLHASPLADRTRLTPRLQATPGRSAGARLPSMSEGTNTSITFVCTSLFKGGAETQLVRLALGLRKRGWLVRIVTIMDLDDFGELLSSEGITVESLGIPRGRYDPRSLPALTRILRRHEPDVVCTFMFHGNVL